jgi:hypothetical protein
VHIRSVAAIRPGVRGRAGRKKDEQELKTLSDPLDFARSVIA